MRTRVSIAMWQGLVAVATVIAAWSLSVADDATAEQAATAPDLAVAISTGQPEPGPMRLVGSRDRRQLIVTATPHGSALEVDATGSVSWRVEPASLATVEPGGMLVPLADGEGRVVATTEGAEEVAVPLVVERVGNDPPIDFISQIVPVFTKYGCNGGGCHGKSGGQNGFRLSLLGFEPAEDHEHLVKEARGRRISLVAPETSLLLAKAAAEVPHGGGKLIEVGSPSYQLLAEWIREGARPSGAKPPQVARIEVFPIERTLMPGQRQQLRVMAFFDDGRIEDVTRMAQYEVNAPDLAEVAVDGLVTATDPGDGPARCGTVAVMVRYQSHVGVFRGTTPLQTPGDLVPPAAEFARTFLDEQVLAHLRKLGLPPSSVCDDATFLRRVTIDIAGRLPTSEETQQFLADSDAGKRDGLIDRLLDSEDYAHNFATKWSAILRNKRPNNELHRHGSYSFYDWIRQSIAENKPYSEFVRDIITATGEPNANPAVIWYRQVSDINQQVEDASQLFLGQRLQCARCHHHPFEKWGTDDYFELAAFFSRIGRKQGLQPGEDRLFHNRGVATANGPKGTHKAAVLGADPGEMPIDTDPPAGAGRLDGGRRQPILCQVAGKPLLETLLCGGACGAGRRHAGDQSSHQPRAARRDGHRLHRARLRHEVADPGNLSFHHVSALGGAQRLQRPGPPELLPVFCSAAVGRDRPRRDRCADGQPDELRWRLAGHAGGRAARPQLRQLLPDGVWPAECRQRLRV